MVSGLKPTNISWLAVVLTLIFSWMVLFQMSRKQKRKRQAGPVSGCPKFVLRALEQGWTGKLFFSRHWFPLLEKVEIRAFILPRNFPAVLIIFTGRGGEPPLPTVRGQAGNPPLPAGKVPRGAGRPSLLPCGWNCSVKTSSKWRLSLYNCLLWWTLCSITHLSHLHQNNDMFVEQKT